MRYGKRNNIKTCEEETVVVHYDLTSSISFDTFRTEHDSMLQTCVRENLGQYLIPTKRINISVKSCNRLQDVLCVLYQRRRVDVVAL